MVHNKMKFLSLSLRRPAQLEPIKIINAMCVCVCLCLRLCVILWLRPCIVSIVWKHKWKLFVLREFLYKVIVKDMVLCCFVKIFIFGISASGGGWSCGSRSRFFFVFCYPTLTLSFSCSLSVISFIYATHASKWLLSFGDPNDKRNITANKWNKFPPQTPN